MEPSFYATVEAIRRLWAVDGYDHRPRLPDLPGLEKWIGDERFRATYAAFKHTVASILQPTSICEIGVGFGVSAHAFLDACPQVLYAGYDDGSMDPRILRTVRELQGPGRTVFARETSRLDALPSCDFCHVDGCHLMGHQAHDVGLALRAATWVLVDDARDSQVAAATMLALFGYQPGDCLWAYFEGTWSGDILIYTGRKHEEQKGPASA